MSPFVGDGLGFAAGGDFRPDCADAGAKTPGRKRIKPSRHAAPIMVSENRRLKGDEGVVLCFIEVSN